VLWYQGFDLTPNPADQTWGLGVKTSADGATWSDFNGGERILDLSRAYNGIQYCWPLAVTHSAATGYAGYLAGAPQGSSSNVCQVYRFTGQSLDASDSFAFESEPTLAAGPEGYDQAGMAALAITKWSDNQYFMFYIGFREWVTGNGYQSSSKHTLNMATSSDGEHWTKSPNNPLPINRMPQGVVSDVAVQNVGGLIHIWVTDYYEDLGKQAVGYYVFDPDIAAYP